MRHNETYKQRHLAEVAAASEKDAVLQYYKRCDETNTLPLAIFEKIYWKTLCLQDYVLSEGQC